MTCNSSAREEVVNVLPKKERIDLEADLEDNTSPLASRLNGAAKNEHQKKGKTSAEEMEATARAKSEIPVSPLKLSNMPRVPTLLERSILPGISRSDEPDAIGSPSDGNSSGSQLTIFYAGVINVYDNVPVDKAKAIMLLAGESSSPKPVAVELPKTENKKPLPHSRVLPSSRSQADLPIARKTSLQHFLERRRHRITRKSPYSRQCTEEKKTEPVKDEGSDEDHHGIPLSPFPSRLGFLFPANKAHLGR